MSRRRPLILLFAWALLVGGIASLANAQLMLTGAGKKPSGGFVASCTQSSNFLARASTVTSNTDKTNYDNLLCGLETDTLGCSNTLDALYIWAAVDQTAAVLNLCSASFALVAHGTVNFSAYHGYTGDGSTFYLDSQFVPSSAAGFFALNLAHVSVYVLTNRTTNNGYFAVGTTDSGANYTFIRPKNAGGNADYEVNSSVFASAVSSTAQGQWFANRDTSAVTELFRNGNTTPFANSGADASNSLSSHSIAFFADNDIASVVGFSADQMAAGTIGKGVASSGDMNKITARINTFMTAYGINVY